MFLIRTGVPSIDELFHHRDPAPNAQDNPSRYLQSGIQLENRETTASFCIAGPDGAGKSVLAFHIASRYLADTLQSGSGEGLRPQVFYVSSDLTYSVARTIWGNFGLHAPNKRLIPFRHPQFQDETLPDWLAGSDRAQRRTFDRELSIELESYPPDQPEKLAKDVFLPAEHTKKLAFIDLASRTAGDDWAFIHRLLAVLPAPDAGVPRHLLVIDAVEGMETFGGDLDAFGERSPRRARIAKLMRLANGKAHIVLVIEEPSMGTRLPEQFVSDVVIRMRSQDDHGYMRRTIEVEKARGQPTVRGRHPYVIRSGNGSTTGSQQNADDPRLESIVPAAREGAEAREPKAQSYMEAFPSIHYISRLIMEEHGRGRPEAPGHCAGFGIHYLDQMLAEVEPPKDEAARALAKSMPGDARGLPCSTVTALIGDAGTQKTGLSLTFLAHTFDKYATRLAADFRGKSTRPSDADLHEYSKLAGVAVLTTTHDENHETLSKYFLQHLESNPAVAALLADEWWRERVEGFIKSRTICRRLEIHDSPPAVLLHTFRRTVEAAQQILKTRKADAFAKEPLAASAELRFSDSWPIRLVIDDFNTIFDTYAQARVDPLFLPFLLFYLRREGVTSLIQDSRPGGPYAQTEGFHTDLRALSDHRIYTWHLTDFFGDHRIAIAPIPPVAQSHRMVVRELTRSDDSRDQPKLPSQSKPNLVVRTNFELYAGLEDNKPRPVPLQVWLYGESDGCGKYAEYLDGLFQKMFTPARSSNGDARIVFAEPPEYGRLRDFAALQGDTRLDHTLVFQVDEFWTGKRTFRIENEYLNQSKVADAGQKGADKDFDDPYGTYRQIKLAQKAEPAASYKRSDFFDVPACNLTDPRVDRIPFSRDYGFLACRERPWQEAAADKDIKKVWDQIKTPSKSTISWRDFLKTAWRVAKIESKKHGERIPAFDLSMMGPESFSCLVLEVWLSEIRKTAERRGNTAVANRLADQVRERRWQRSPEGLLEWFGGGEPNQRLAPLHAAAAAGQFRGYTLELYKAWLLLIEALDLTSLQNDPGSVDFKTGRIGNGLAVASRRWYKTACHTGADEGVDPGPIRYCRLPGHFTTRGDWFLAVASGSRSDRLANRAIDLLCSTRGNYRRMTMGIGVPARYLLQNTSVDASRLPTALRTERGPAGQTLNYSEVLALGADQMWKSPADFGWLWRSSLKDYQSHAVAWQEWLYRVLTQWQALQVGEPTWLSGFDVYDQLDDPKTENLPREILDLPSFKDFPKWCENLVAELDASR